MIHLRDVRLYAQRFPLRRPFRFGIVELSELEHLVVAVDFAIDGEVITGFAGENLVPRWFVKDPSLAIEDEIASMRQAIRIVGEAALRQPPTKTPFDLWWQLHRFVRDRTLVTPPLLAQLAESLIERAAIDAWCRLHGATFSEMLRSNQLGVDFGRVHGSLRDISSSELSSAPAKSLFVRHTVGLADDLRELPSLLRRSGIRRLKIKLGGDATSDANRVSEALRMCASDAWPIDRITVDGNENYLDLLEFERLVPHLAAMKDLAWIEQPFHRSIAMSDEVRPFIERLRCPPMIIDESDTSPADLPHALDLGYAGTTHKSCKGVFNSIIHRAILARPTCGSRKPAVFSGEDLTIVAPWSQASDLAVAAAVGVVDIERNGQHFADGLSGFGAGVGEQALADFPMLYQRRDDGIAELRIADGQVCVPAHVGSPPNLAHFMELTS